MQTTLDLSNPTMAEVKAIFGDCFDLPIRFLHATTEAGRHNLPDLLEAMELINYNEFVGEEVAEVLWDLHSKGKIMTVRFGRAYSPVLFVTPPHWTNQATNSSPEDGNKLIENRQEIFEEIENALKPVKPDELWKECSTIENKPLWIRAWWD